MAIPTYAVDLPEGGGKIPLNEGTVLGIRDGWYILAGPEGREYKYPVEGQISR
jgi:lysine 2,3-aminomutase